MTNHEMIKRAMEPHRGETLRTEQVRAIVLEAFPHFKTGSLLPNDHGAGNKSCCWCVGTTDQIFEPVQYGLYRVLLNRAAGRANMRVEQPTSPARILVRDLVRRPEPTKDIRATHQRYQGAALWERITDCLNRFLPSWRNRLTELGQVEAVQSRVAGRRWNDSEVFEGLILAVLSNSIDWSLIEALRPELSLVFSSFNLVECANFNDDEVRRIVNWFAQRRATLPYNGDNLIRAIGGVRMLSENSRRFGSLEAFFNTVLGKNGGDPKRLAVALGDSASHDKLPGLGIPLAAEFLKNIGYDVAKPDRHVNRAGGCFGMVNFTRWPDRSGHSTPQASTAELMMVMVAVGGLARQVGELVTFVDNAVWLLCAKSGLHLSNSQLVKLATM